MAIGFKTQAQQKEQTESLQKVDEKVDDFTASQILGKSMAHVSVMNRINVISEFITTEKFAELPTEMRVDYVKNLIDQVALNAELNVKNEKFNMESYG